MPLDVRAPPFAAVANVNAHLTALHAALPPRTELLLFSGLYNHGFVPAEDKLNVLGVAGFLDDYPTPE